MLKKIFVVLMILVSIILVPGRGYSLEASITDFLINTSDTDLLVHFKVKHCFTKKMEEAILAGIPTTFTFFLELYRERDFWFDSKLVSGVTRHTVKYDNVKKIFYLTFSGNGRGERRGTGTPEPDDKRRPLLRQSQGEAGQGPPAPEHGVRLLFRFPVGL
jgi:hypothetical protein